MNRNNKIELIIVAIFIILSFVFPSIFSFFQFFFFISLFIFIDSLLHWNDKIMDKITKGIFFTLFLAFIFVITPLFFYPIYNITIFWEFIIILPFATILTMFSEQKNEIHERVKLILIYSIIYITIFNLTIHNPGLLTSLLLISPLLLTFLNKPVNKKNKLRLLSCYYFIVFVIFFLTSMFTYFNLRDLRNIF